MDHRAGWLKGSLSSKSPRPDRIKEDSDREAVLFNSFGAILRAGRIWRARGASEENVPRTCTFHATWVPAWNYPKQRAPPLSRMICNGPDQRNGEGSREFARNTTVHPRQSGQLVNWIFFHGRARGPIGRIVRSRDTRSKWDGWIFWNTHVHHCVWFSEDDPSCGTWVGTLSVSK